MAFRITKRTPQMRRSIIRRNLTRAVSSSHYEQTDLLVVGCGVGGCAAALTAAELGQKVTILTSAKNRNDSNSFWAQGGIIYKAPGDNEASDLANDVMTAGWNVNKVGAVNLVSRSGPQAVKDLLLSDLEQMPSIDFDKNKQGELSLCKEGGHSAARIIHYKDATGKAITEGMTEAVANHENIELREAHTALDLIMSPGGECLGALVKPLGQSPRTILAKETFLATGGMGELFLHTSNPPEAQGDGTAIAARAGAKIENLEYMQFHPTTLYIPGERRFLLTEALRGDGAILRDHNGRAFASDYHPMADLAPRDIVSRMILFEMKKSNQPHMWLDISHMDSEYLAERFPTIYQHCLERGLDFTKEPLPVVPAAHYSCGGITVDTKGRTTIPRLRAIGEVSCTGLHGANRLASTSLLEGLVYGKWAAYEMVREASINDYQLGEEFVPKLPDMEYPEAPAAEIDAYWSFIKETMWGSFGPERNLQDMVASKAVLELMEKQIEDLYEVHAWSPGLYGLRNAFKASNCLAEAAIANTESTGCHYLSAESEGEAPDLHTPMVEKLEALHGKTGDNLTFDLYLMKETLSSKWAQTY